mgnify:CR=1 FL=1
MYLHPRNVVIDNYEQKIKDLNELSAKKDLEIDSLNAFSVKSLAKSDSLQNLLDHANVPKKPLPHHHVYSDYDSLVRAFTISFSKP